LPVLRTTRSRVDRGLPRLQRSTLAMTTEFTGAVAVKNTFLDFAGRAPSHSLDGARRAASLPPPGCRAPCPGTFHDQLERLTAIAMGAHQPAFHRQVARAEPSMGRGALTMPRADGRGELGELGARELSAFIQSFDWADAVDGEDVGQKDQPKDERGVALPSVGSREHAAGTCRPCAFARSHAGCRFGVSCNFCHVAEGHLAKERSRPCKGKRDRMRKAVAAIESRVADDPALLETGNISVPAIIERDKRANDRVLARLVTIAAAARAAALTASPTVGLGR